APEEKQQLDVYRVPARAMLGDGVGDAFERHSMHDDVLMIGPAAVTDAGQSGGPDEGETLAEHSRRRVELAEFLPVRRAITGLFLQFARRALDRILAVGLVADQAGRKLKAELAERHPILLDQDRLPGIDREDHGGSHVARSA